MIRKINRSELLDLIDTGVQIVDVLPAAEYTESHLPNAINTPLKAMDAATTNVLDRHQPIVVYCHDGL